ncbi:zinc finger protein 155-like isoform X3 [Physella acuta]|uniref:zinc finger protein 155-like isoform X3 n=1 Tax=Physella acuta TaxID=109671 RepID=UPI0027DCF3C5|nr:zinc finger protein 155-like isoform X3 [Physella acuta]
MDLEHEGYCKTAFCSKLHACTIKANKMNEVNFQTAVDEEVAKSTEISELDVITTDSAADDHTKTHMTQELSTNNNTEHVSNGQFSPSSDSTNKTGYENKNTVAKLHKCKKKYECDVCHKTFLNRKDLSMHKIHSGEKPHECGVCHKKFIHRQHLYNHTRIHIIDKPYECEVCCKKFFKRNDLSMHKIHSGEKPFECEATSDKCFSHIMESK